MQTAISMKTVGVMVGIALALVCLYMFPYAREALRLSNVLLGIANRHTEIEPLLKDCVSEVRRLTGCAAAGMRLLDQDGNIPYAAQEGFDNAFYESENALSVACDQCLCISVITGERDPELSCYTAAGSICIRSTSQMVAEASSELKARTRNACNRFGYESVALVPIRLGDQVLGLVHVADPGRNRLPADRVELLETAAELSATEETVSPEE